MAIHKNITVLSPKNKFWINFSNFRLDCQKECVAAIRLIDQEGEKRRNWGQFLKVVRNFRSVTFALLSSFTRISIWYSHHLIAREGERNEERIWVNLIFWSGLFFHFHPRLWLTRRSQRCEGISLYGVFTFLSCSLQGGDSIANWGKSGRRGTGVNFISGWKQQF